MQHVMVDLYGCPQDLLSDKRLLQQILEEYPSLIGMERVSPVVLEDIKTSNPLDEGMSGFVIIATSHISLHAWPCYGMANFDIFSCEPFDAESAVQFASSMLTARDVEVHAVERATRSPRIASGNELPATLSL